MEPTTTKSEAVVSKKFSDVIRTVFSIIGSRIRKSKFMSSLHNMSIKGGKSAGKAIISMMLHHQSSHQKFVAPKEYEFSCSSTPAHHLGLGNKRKKHNVHYFSPAHSAVANTEITAVSALEKILEMLDSEQIEGSPYSPYLPEFGCGPPFVRQLRITDSPFPSVDMDEDNSVDRDAEDFIEGFYAQLKLQMKMSES